MPHGFSPAGTGRICPFQPAPQPSIRGKRLAIKITRPRNLRCNGMPPSRGSREPGHFRPGKYPSIDSTSGMSQASRSLATRVHLLQAVVRGNDGVVSTWLADSWLPWPCGFLAAVVQMEISLPPAGAPEGEHYLAMPVTRPGTKEKGRLKEPPLIHQASLAK